MAWVGMGGPKKMGGNGRTKKKIFENFVNFDVLVLEILHVSVA